MQRPFEVDNSEYPFQDHWLPYRDGMIHYIDEGEGPVVVLLHGNPTWSYLYRNVIKELSGQCRLIAPDYPGFGMSKAPTGYGYTPQEHAEAVTALIKQLDLQHVVLVVQDWGGPVGLHYAVHHPDNVRGIVLMNTWAWPAKILPMKLFSMTMGGWPLGYWLQTRRNFLPIRLCPAAFTIRRRSRQPCGRRIPILFLPRRFANRPGCSPEAFAKPDRGWLKLNPDCLC